MENDKGLTEKSKRMRNVTPKTGQLLSFMATVTQAKQILEIGTSNGYSTLWLADSAAKNQGLVTTIEYSAAKANLAKINFEQAEMQESINLVVQDAGRYIKQLQPRSVDLIFLDSDRKEYVEWWSVLRTVLKQNGLIIVDNILSHHTELQEFIGLVSNDKSYSAFQLSIESGMLLLTRMD
ncbi:O-methyltransferase [Neobacillus sp. Marseille-QA0830]